MSASVNSLRTPDLIQEYHLAGLALVVPGEAIEIES
jgi:hypothetical protein